MNNCLKDSSCNKGEFHASFYGLMLMWGNRLLVVRAVVHLLAVWNLHRLLFVSLSNNKVLGSLPALCQAIIQEKFLISIQYISKGEVQQ
ncbi:hypothetical protein D3C72_2021820 [compost metagenome]